MERELTPELAEALAGWRDQGRLSNEAARALRGRRRRAVTGTAGGVAAIMFAIALPHMWRGPAPDRVASLQTRRGEARSVRLPDGTTLQLEGATSLTVRYGRAGRDVTLAGGAAFFDVVHDPARPFTVRAGDGAIRVLGTAFNVDRTAGRLDVAVYRGSVRLAGRDDTRGEWVPAGWRGHVAGGHAGPAARFDARSSDRRDWLDVDGLRLADLVAILNRRSGPEIVPPPGPLANLPISGRFRTGDAQSLLNSMGMAYGFSVRNTEHSLIISKIAEG